MKKAKPGGESYGFSPPYENKGALLAPFLFANHLTQYYKQIGSPKIAKAKSIGSRPENPLGSAGSPSRAKGNPKGSIHRRDPRGAFGPALYGLISFEGGRSFGSPPAPFFSSWVVGLMEGAGVFKITGAKKGIWRERDPGTQRGRQRRLPPILPAHLQIPNSYFFIQWLLFSSSFSTYKIIPKKGGRRGPEGGPYESPLIEFELILGPKEGATGYLLRKKLGFGSITFDRKGSVRYHVKNKTHLRNLISSMMEKGALKTPSVIGKDPEGDPYGSSPAIKILELGPPPLLTNAKDLGNFNLDAWLSGFFETTCSFQIFHKRFKRRDPKDPLASKKKRSFGSKMGGEPKRVPLGLNFSVGIGARPNSTPPFTNPNWRDPWDPIFNISIEHNNKIALLIFKNYFGGHIARTGYLPPPLNIEGPFFEFVSKTPPFTQNPTSLMPLQRKKSFIYKLSNKNALKKLIKILGRENLKTKKRIEFLKWSKIFFSIIESQTTSTPLTNRNKKRIKDFLLIKRDSF
uniref:Uncharacterized protein n=1 Tax=Placozoa sp. H19 TaxID=1265248 RepID=A0A7I6NEH1_9METZ|nr:hypothetical protein [Placozoa sp. H19 HM-2017]